MPGSSVAHSMTALDLAISRVATADIVGGVVSRGGARLALQPLAPPPPEGGTGAGVGVGVGAGVGVGVGAGVGVEVGVGVGVGAAATTMEMSFESVRMPSET